MRKVMIFGDICSDNDYRSLFESRPNGPLHEEIIQEMHDAVLVIGNLECPATDNDVPITKCGPNLRARPKDIDLLRAMGFDVLSLANNHILDYGFAGIEETIAQCRICGIQTVGAGRNTQAAAEPLLVEKDQKRIGILSFAEAEFNI